MFWNNRNAERIRELEEKVTSKIEKLEQSITAGGNQLSDANRSLAQLQNTVREQGMSIEDLLEEWSERKETENGLREQLRGCARNEEHLLELFEAYQEQFGNLQRFAKGKDEAWTEQIKMMEQGMEHYRQLCGISLAGECGMEVDYDLHEVIRVVDTEQEELDRKIADVYSFGYLYQGRVRKKARVAAYAYKKSESGMGSPFGEIED